MTNCASDKEHRLADRFRGNNGLHNKSEQSADERLTPIDPSHASNGFRQVVDSGVESVKLDGV